MKKSLMIVGILFVGSTFFSSCNKKIKEDMEDLEKEVADLKTQNANLTNQQNATNAILGANEPITATTTYVDDNDSTRTRTDTYSFKAGNYSTQYMEDNGDGTYDIYIERFSDVDWYEGAWVEFTYDPTTQAITNKSGGHYWSDNDPYYDNARYDESATTLTLTLHSISVVTGNISLSFSASGDDVYTNAIPYYYTPNQGKAMATTFSFTGKLKVFSAL